MGTFLHLHLGLNSLQHCQSHWVHLSVFFENIDYWISYQLWRVAWEELTRTKLSSHQLTWPTGETLQFQHSCTISFFLISKRSHCNFSWCVFVTMSHPRMLLALWEACHTLLYCYSSLWTMFHPLSSPSWHLSRTRGTI